MERMPWEAGFDEWRIYLEKQLSGCLDIERGRCEAQKFLSSDLAQQLVCEEVVVRTEVPLFFKADDETAYDGSIDLLAYDQSASRWLVVDWKTDRLGNDGVDGLIECYGRQLLAYRDGIKTCYPDDEIVVMLYSTRSGSASEVVGV